MNNNYKYIVHSPKKQQTAQITLKYNQVVNIEQIPKFKYKSPRMLAKQITTTSPTIQLNNSNKRQKLGSKSRSPSIEQNWFNVKKIKKKVDPFENLNYGQPKIFHKLSPELLIPSQLSTPITTQHVEKRIIIKKKTEPIRITRSDTQYSISRQEIKNTSSSRIMQKREYKKEPSGELKGWQGYADHFDDYL